MYDIVTIGSATIDIFADTGNKLFSSQKPFGKKILIDKLFISTGGGAINTAVAFSRFGLKAACIAKVGPDFKIPREIDDRFIIKSNKTDYSIILDSAGKDRIILVHRANKLNFSEIELPKTKWIYLSSMPENFLKNFINLEVKLALNTTKAPKELLARAEILILNKEEVENLGARARLAKILVITNKDKEIKVFYNNKEYKAMPNRNIKAVERTGAGDALAAGFIAGIIRNKDIACSLGQAIEYSEKIIQKHGAHS